MALRTLDNENEMRALAANDLGALLEFSSRPSAGRADYFLSLVTVLCSVSGFCV